MFYIGLLIVGISIGFLVHSISWAFFTIGCGIILSEVFDYINKWENKRKS